MAQAPRPVSKGHWALSHTARVICAGSSQLREPGALRERDRLISENVVRDEHPPSAAPELLVRISAWPGGSCISEAADARSGAVTHVWLPGGVLGPVFSEPGWASEGLEGLYHPPVIKILVCSSGEAG